MESPLGFAFSILAYTPFVIGILIFLLWRLNVSVERSFRTRLDQAAERLRRLRSTFQSHTSLLDNVHTADEPYKSHINHYQKLLLANRERLRKIHVLYNDLKKSYNAHRQKNIVQGIKQGHKIQTDLAKLDLDLETLQVQVSYLDKERQIIDDLAWDVAQEIQSSNAALTMALDDLRQVRGWGWRSDRLEDVQNAAAALVETIRAQVPIVFFSPNPTLVLAQTDYNDVIRAHRVISSLAEDIRHIADQTGYWAKSAIQVPMLIGISQNRSQLIQQVIRELENSELFPLRCDTSVGKLHRLQAMLNQVTRGLDKRSLDNLLETEKVIREIDQFSEMLQGEIEKLSELHRNFSAWSISAEIRNSTLIIQEYKQINDHLLGWHPANFDRGDMVESLEHEIQKLQVAYEQIFDISPLQPLSESELPLRSKAVADFQTGVYLLKPRVDSIRNTLAHLTRQEAAARLEIKGANELVAFLITDVIPVENAKFAKELQKQGLHLEGIFKDRQKTILADIQKKISAFSERVIELSVVWDGKITESITAIVMEIQMHIEKITEAATLHDPLLAEFVALDRKISDLEQPEQEKSDLLSQQIMVLRRDAQNLELLINYRSRLFTPLIPILRSLEEINKWKDKISQHMQKLTAAIPEEGFGWPLTTQKFTGEDHRLRRLEQDYKNLKGSPIDLKRLLSTLKSFSEQFQTIEKQLAMLEERVVYDQSKILDYLQRFEKSKNLWNKVRAQHKHSQTFVSSLDTFLADAEKKLAELESECRQGRYPYAQALARLRLICKHLDESQILFDQGQVIDINGYIEARP
jgi:hypothetical protein